MGRCFRPGEDSVRPSESSCRRDCHGTQVCSAGGTTNRRGFHVATPYDSGNTGEYFVADAESVHLRIEVREGGVCAFGIVDEDDQLYQIGPCFHARPGRWIGAKVGIYCLTPDVLETHGHADFDYFRITALRKIADETNLSPSRGILPPPVLAPS